MASYTAGGRVPVRIDPSGDGPVEDKILSWKLFVRVYSFIGRLRMLVGRRS